MCIIDMNISFSTRLAQLRKEKKVSQKTAAAALGVSQALLSHYEKGIRECGLDFLRRTCEYYDVSSDYLLGLCKEQKKLPVEPCQDELSEKEDDMSNTLRCYAVKICEDSGMSREEAEHCLRRMGALSAYRTALMLADKSPEDRACMIQALEAESLLSAYIKQQSGAFSNENLENHLIKADPEVLKNIISSCESRMKDRTVSKMAKK